MKMSTSDRAKSRCTGYSRPTVSTAMKKIAEEMKIGGEKTSTDNRKRP